MQYSDYNGGAWDITSKGNSVMGLRMSSKMWYSQILTGHDGVKELALKLFQMSSLFQKVVPQMDMDCEALIANDKAWGVLSDGSLEWDGRETY